MICPITANKTAGSLFPARAGLPSGGALAVISELLSEQCSNEVQYIMTMKAWKSAGKEQIKMFRTWMKNWCQGLPVVLLALLAMSANAQTSFVPLGATWKYLDNGSDQGTVWFDPDFDDSGWLAGPAELGFGDGGEVTTNTAGFITYYYRHEFNVADTASITNLRARYLRDDGLVAYLNGAELFRDNMPTGAVTSATLAATTAADDGMVFQSMTLNPAVLHNGRNVLAVEVHQAATTSSDISFALELMGNPLPAIAINNPTNNQVIVGANVIISGNATPAGSSVALVEAFAGVTKVGESTNATYTISWSSVPPGNYTLRTKLTDNLGLVATSAPVNITVQAPPASVLVPAGSIWKFLDTGVDQGTGWTALGFDDSGWRTGPAELGYGDGDEATIVSFGPDTNNKFTTTYFRRVINVPNPGAYADLTMTLTYDDGAVVYINGAEVYRINMPAGPVAYGTFAVAATDYTPDVSTLPTSVLVAGNNVIAVEVHQANLTSSDISFNLQLQGSVDDVPPVVVAINPPQGSVRTELSSINVIFDGNVQGVNASDLLIKNEGATGIVTNSPRDYTFTFPQPTTGLVQVAFAPNHGITDTSPLGNPFAGLSWTYTLDPNASPRPNVVISEFLADNNNGIKDEDGQRNDWVELLNLGPLDANIDGWFLTDTPTNLTKWRIPAVAMQANAYVLIWCSSKNRANLNSPLHTNFRLQKEAGGYVALVDPSTNVVSSFTYPVQTADISFGRDPGDPTLSGYFSTPTPAAQNLSSGPGVLGEPLFSLPSGVYTSNSIVLAISNTNSVGGTIRYTTNSTLPTNTSLIYTGAITFSINSTIKARVFPPAGTNLLPSTIVARNFIFLDGTSSNFSSRLPTVIISTEGRAIPANVPPGGNRAKGSFVVIDTVQGRSFVRGQSEVHELAEFEIFGQTSAGFQKQPIRVEIQDALGNDLDKSVLGMPADSDWRLRNPYNDKTLLNDFLGFELWEKMGHYSVRRHLVDVLLDTGGGRLIYPNDYYGVMVLTETIKVNKDRVDIQKITPYNTNLFVTNGGFIFKRDKDSDGDLNFSSAPFAGSGFAAIPLKLHEPKAQSMRKVPIVSGQSSFPGPGYTTSGTNQMNYLRNFMGTMERALYTNTWTSQTGTNHYSYYLDPVRFADQMLHVEYTKQIDGYRLSDYFTKGNDGRIGPGPVWDWNLAYGNADYLAGGQTNGWYYEATGETDHPWARRLISGTAASTTTSGDPNFVQLVADRWAMFRTNILNATNTIREIDELSLLLSESAARDLYGKYRSALIGVYTWPNPAGTADGRDVDYVHPTNYLGPIETVWDPLESTCRHASLSIL